MILMSASKALNVNSGSGSSRSDSFSVCDDSTYIQMIKINDIRYKQDILADQLMKDKCYLPGQ